ncbi:hypothetical protein [Streptomyces xanthii]|uniref:Uncharacterized protein n=1 Tax=Streptomyces xanthii TaxID=2768069 RepID=A0A7H1BL31_9ACTN|nr:hypothetical protein [Streptomyces xanthii]QNS09436.1 hypothetical protein IAG42_37365 [Streptomyces xanthii]
MAIDHVKRQRTLDAAEELLRERYGEGRNYLDPITVMQEVRAQAFGYSVREGEEAPEVPAEDLLAALTQVEEARARLDSLERDLIRGARNRSASWQKIADSLGMANRQAAEARATRLERAAESHSRDRDVPTQRRERARQRAVEAWCAAHQARIRQTVQRLVDVGEAWPQLAEDYLTSHYLRALENKLKGDADGVKLLDDLEMLLPRLTPQGQPPLEPAGERAPEAAQARDAALALLSDLATVRLEVDAARMSTVR